MKLLKTIIIMFLVCGFISDLHAINDNAGTAGLQVLKIGVGARSVGMGGAFTAITNDATSIYHNPSGLAMMENRAFSFNHLVYFKDINYANFSAGFPMRSGAFGISFSQLWMDPITALENEFAEPSTIEASDTVVTVAYAKNTADINPGIALKVISSKIADATAVAYAADLSATIRVADNMKVAVVAQNLGTEIRFKGDDVGGAADKLPSALKLGYGYNLGAANMAFDISVPNDSDVNIKMGLEYNLRLAMFNFPLRFGYATMNNTGDLKGLLGGLGISNKRFSLDFAWTPFNVLGDAYRTSFAFKL